MKQIKLVSIVKMKVYVRCVKKKRNQKKCTVSWVEFEADHILPHSKGGKSELWNGQVLCRTHNRRKSNKI
jgi:5-methylcytosine-specific restriction endonuclease McrA